MTAEFDVEAYVALMAATLGLTILPDWRPGVVANMAAVKRAADLVTGLDLGDHAEPAPVFTAGFGVEAGR
ncbi:MAG: DUF4089 domain-containing protein [Ancalomicrobiaceae bacterium]|nr:DUF4089 domain-containing protein [Ancalomicrobiaceae bacterium]